MTPPDLSECRGDVKEAVSKMRALVDETLARLHITSENPTNFMVENEDYEMVEVGPEESEVLGQFIGIEEKPKRLDVLCIDGVGVDLVSKHDLNFQRGGKIEYVLNRKLAITSTDYSTFKELWHSKYEFDSVDDLPDDVKKIIDDCAQILPTLNIDRAQQMIE